MVLYDLPPPDDGIEVMVSYFESGLISACQSDQVNRCTRGDHIIYSGRTVRARIRLSQCNKLLQVDQHAARSNGGALVSLVTQSKCANSRVMCFEKQVRLVRQKKSSVLEQPIAV